MDSREVVRTSDAEMLLRKANALALPTQDSVVEVREGVEDSADPNAVALAVKAAKVAAITLLSMRTCFSTGTRPE